MARETVQKSRVWLWIGAGVLLITVFIVARAMSSDKIPIHAATVKRAELVSTTPTNGLVEPERNYEFHSPLATTISEIYVHEGDKVSAGKLLMKLDDASARARVASGESGLRAAEATLEAIQQGGTLEERQSLSSSVSSAKLDLAQKQRDLASLKALQATGAASASEVSAAQERLTLAQQTVDSYQARQQTRYSPAELERARAAVTEAQANLAASRDVLDKTSIRAPVDGTVYSIPIGRSDFVEEGKLLLQMADLTHLRVRAYFDEPEIGLLAIGQKIRITWDAARPGKEWHGHIVSTPSTIISYTTRNVGEVLVTIDDPDDGLLPATHVTVTVTTSSEPNVLTMPREALHSENGKPYVFRVVNGSLVRTPITIGTPNLTEVPVESGLSDGAVVATGSLNGVALEEGSSVKVVR
jgi:HlyD family secretion protein